MDVFGKDAAQLSSLSTVADFLRWLTTEFSRAQLHYGHGSDEAWDEAVLLLTDSLGLPHDRVMHLLAARLLDHERELLLERARRRIVERVPVPYLTGVAWFAGLRFIVSTDVLIPRSPIAELIRRQFSPWLPQEPTRILDLCCGSGCLGIAAALEFPNAQVVIADLSPGALRIAEQNIGALGVKERVTTCASDLFKGIQGAFDVILCNPPYVPLTSYVQLPPEYLHEPRMALVAEEDGMALVRRILVECAPYLSDTGVLVLEVGEIATRVDDLLADIEHVWAELEQGGEGVLVVPRNGLVDFAKIAG